MAGTVITTGSHPSLLWPGVFRTFGNSYDRLPKEYTAIFEQLDSDKYQERVVEISGFDIAPVKTQGASIEYDTDAEGNTTVFTHVVYGKGFMVTREEGEDLQYLEVSRTRAGALSFSMNTTVEIVHANIFNRAFDTNYPLGDGKPLLSATHPSRAGSQSNLLTAADFSEASFEDGLKNIANVTNSRGLPIRGMADKLLIGTDTMFDAERITNSTGRVGTANNDINATKAMGMLPGGVVVNHYFTDKDAWFLITNQPNGPMTFWRRKPSLERDNDFDTENLKAKSTMRFSCGVADWRSVYGSAGA